MNVARPVLAAGIIAIIAPVVTAQTATYEVLTQAAGANDLTPDGRFIVGDHINGGGYIYDRGTGVYTEIGGLGAVAVSDDGAIVLGNIVDPQGIGSNVAAIWTQAAGWQSLGALPNALGCPSRSDGYELSADGSVAVGLSWDGCNGRGFRWTAATGMQELQVLAEGGNRASVVSADGKLIGGFAQGSFSRTPAIWSGNTTGQLLDPPDGDALGEVLGISDDGDVLLGEWNGKPFKWDLNTGMELFNTVLPGWGGNAMDIAQDGTIVGFDFLAGNRRAWIRLPGQTNPVNFRQYIFDHGAANAPSNIEVCQAISADGRVIIGHGFTAAWVVVIEPDCPSDLAGSTGPDPDGNIDVFDLFVLLSNWNTAGPGANLAAPTNLVDVFDLFVLLGAWGDC